MQLTEEEAFQAMFLFLEKYYHLTKADDVGNLLGSLMIVENGKPLDIALWYDWIKSVEEVKKRTES